MHKMQKEIRNERCNAVVERLRQHNENVFVCRRLRHRDHRIHSLSLHKTHTRNARKPARQGHSYSRRRIFFVQSAKLHHVEKFAEQIF